MDAAPVLVVDDDPKIVGLVGAYLDRAGYRVITAADGEQALKLVHDENPCLIVLDVMLPGVDGLVLARHLRDSNQTVPILMMSARGRVDDRIRGLVEGADDYLAKPFSPAELVVRVNALLRRSAPAAVATTVLKHGQLEVDLDRREVRLEGRPITLTDVEFRMLVAVLQAGGRVLTRSRLIDIIYGMDRDVLGRTVSLGPVFSKLRARSSSR